MLKVYRLNFDDDNFSDVRQIRNDVFIVEQGVSEFDEYDNFESSARHYLIKKNNVSCGIQINDVNSENIKKNIDLGFNFIVLGSDLFALWKWAEQVENTIASLK